MAVCMWCALPETVLGIDSCTTRVIVVSGWDKILFMTLRASPLLQICLRKEATIISWQQLQHRTIKLYNNFVHGKTRKTFIAMVTWCKLNQLSNDCYGNSMQIKPATKRWWPKSKMVSSFLYSAFNSHKCTAAAWANNVCFITYEQKVRGPAMKPVTIVL